MSEEQEQVVVEEPIEELSPLEELVDEVDALSDRVDAVEAQANSVAAEVRKVSKLRELIQAEGAAVLAKLKGVRPGDVYDRAAELGKLAKLLVIGLLVVGVSHAESIIDLKYDGDATKGTYKVVSDDAGTITLTVDAIAANVTGGVTGDVTGDVNTDDINATGADTASLDVNIPASTNVQLGTITIKNASTPAQIDDNDYQRIILLQADNSATADVDYVYMDVLIADDTAATEDGTVKIGIEVNSTATEILTLDATGATVVGDVSGTTIGGITEANLVDKSATETIAGTWTFPTLNMTAGYFQVTGTALEYVDGGVTNVIDADVTTP